MPEIELQNFPMISQLADKSWNPGYLYDCVPACIAASLEYLTGKSYDGGHIKDAVYGHQWASSTNPAQFVPYCATQGILMSEVQDADPIHLVFLTQSYLGLKRPVIFSEPDPYADPSLGWTHAVVAYKYDSNTITVMDPYIAQPVTRSNQVWATLLRYNDVWVLRRNEEDGAVVLTIDQAKEYYTEVVTDQRWHCKATTIDIAYGILSYYRSCTLTGLNGLSQYGLPVSGEEGIPNTKQAVLQRFERGVIFYDPLKEVDRVPGLEGACYPGHINTGPGQDPRIDQQHSQ